MIHLSSCSLGIVLWFRIMYGLPSANTTNKTSYAYLFIIFLYFNHPRFCPIIDNIIGWHIKIHWHFIGIFHLAQKDNCLLFKVQSHHRKATTFSKSAGHFWLSKERTRSFPHTPTCSGLKMMLCIVWCGWFPCFIFYCLAHNWHSSFSPQEFSFIILGNWATERFLGGVRIYQILFFFFHLWSFASTTMKFLHALQLFVFSV